MDTDFFKGNTEESPLNEMLFKTPKDDAHALLIKALDVIHDGVLIVDTTTKVCYVNRRYLDMFSVKREKIVGRHLAKFEPLARINDVLVMDTPIYGDISHIYSANIDVYSDMSPLHRNGKLVGAIACMKNITDIVSANKELAHFKQLAEFLQNEISTKDDLPPAFGSISGHSLCFVNVLRAAAKVAQTDASVFLNGESGCGKEVIAQAIHYSSHRASGPYIKINCASVPETLLESELFGYDQGAFTGAKSTGKPGKLELADKGTVFLDEIGDMPYSMQAKLLRVLQEHEIERVGGTKRIKIDFRLITATNRDLTSMIKTGEFREDLYYRINVIPLMIPPLRDRRSDIILLANRFLDEMNSSYKTKLSFSYEAIQLLTAYSWPGNVRELKNCVEQAAVLCPSDTVTIEPQHLPRKFHAAPLSQRLSSDSEYDLHEITARAEKETMAKVLSLAGGNKTKAIKLLNISRRSFYQKLEKYGLD